MRRAVGIGGEFPLEPPAFREGSAPSEDHPPAAGAWLSSGRAAIRLAFQRACVLAGERRRVLLPAYLCPSVLQPFREARVPVTFYRLDERLNVDLDDLSEKLTSDTAAVLLIHYFGIPQSADVFNVARAADPPVAIIDDVSHSWLSGDGIEAPAAPRTFRICSPRKVGALPDGGVLAASDGCLERDAEPAPPHRRFVGARTLGLHLRWCFQQTAIPGVNAAAYRLLDRAERLLDADTLVRRGSRLSKRLFAAWPRKAFAARRRENYEMLARGLTEAGERIRPLFPELPARAVPLGFPIVVRDRERVKRGLIARGIYPPVHWALPQEDGIARYPHLVDVSDRILTIPIDQRYGPAEMNRVLEALNACTA